MSISSSLRVKLREITEASEYFEELQKNRCSDVMLKPCNIRYNKYQSNLAFSAITPRWHNIFVKY